MIDILAKAAFERFSTGFSVDNYGTPYGSGKPTTWDNMAPHLQELWREVARSVLRAKEDVIKTRKYSPQQIARGMTTQLPVNTQITNSPRLPSHTPPKR